MFLAVKKGTKAFWLETDSDLVAQELAAGKENNYWLIKLNEKSGAVSLKPVTLQPVAKINIDRVTISAGGEILGTADSLEEE